MAMAKLKLVIRSVRDAEGARKLYNQFIFRGFYKQAKQVAETLHSFGYAGWAAKAQALEDLISKR